MIPTGYIRFCMVGSSGLLVDSIVLHLLMNTTVFHANIYLCKPIAAEVAIVSNFVWNRLWTFKHRVRNDDTFGDWLMSFAKFNLICLLGMAFGVILLAVQVSHLKWGLYASNVVAVVLVSIFNFLLTERFAWGRQPKK